jgi:hypothetical protein
MLIKLAWWIPLAIAITLLCGLLYVTVHQNYRQTANDPQIQMAEDIAARLSNGDDPTRYSPMPHVDIGKSLMPFVMTVDVSGKIIASSAQLNGQSPMIPSGVLEYAKTHGENRVTWQPANGVRLATVVVPFTGKQSSGYVVVGRSLREVERRENQLTASIALGWIITLLATFVVAVFLSTHKKFNL